MPPNTKATEAEAQQRHEAVKMFRAGHTAPSIATAFHRSRRWVYYWVAYQRQHPHSRLRSASRAPRPREWENRRVKPCPSLSTIQRILQRRGLPQPQPAEARSYRPHPLATYPHAGQATDIGTRWLTGGGGGAA